MGYKNSLRPNAFNHARFDRRQLMQAMGIAAAAGISASFAPGNSLFAEGAQMGASGTGFRAVAYNHINYQVAEYAKVRDFYINLFGMKCVWDDGKQCSLEFGDPPNAIWLAWRLVGFTKRRQSQRPSRSPRFSARLGD